MTTLALALTVGHALLGVVLALAGAGLVLGAGWLPARTGRGRMLLGQIHGVRSFLHSTQPNAVPEQDRELVFSRGLPYAVVLGETERWLAAFAGLDLAADGATGAYWFGQSAAATAGTDMQGFTGSFRAWLADLERSLAQSG